MPIYHTLGKIPHKRHTIFKNGKDRFFYEQLFGTIGFDGMSTLSYHTHRPTMVKEIIASPRTLPRKIAIEKNMRSHAAAPASRPSPRRTTWPRARPCW
jgi:homogentisate 1,2-dioxygenase